MKAIAFKQVGHSGDGIGMFCNLDKGRRDRDMQAVFPTHGYARPYLTSADYDAFRDAENMSAADREKARNEADKERMAERAAARHVDSAKARKEAIAEGRAIRERREAESRGRRISRMAIVLRALMAGPCSKRIIAKAAGCQTTLLNGAIDVLWRAGAIRCHADGYELTGYADRSADMVIEAVRRVRESILITTNDSQ